MNEKSSKRAKSPCYSWYPGDWKRDVALQSCEFRTRAIWREMLDTMHEGEPYGHLTAGGVPITPEQLARIIGVTPKQVRAALDELEARGVFDRTSEGVIYSRRMVRDESLRNRRAAGGVKGGNPALKVNLPDNLPTNLNGNLRDNPAVAVAVAVKNSTGTHQGPKKNPDPSSVAIATGVKPPKKLSKRASSSPQQDAMGSLRKAKFLCDDSDGSIVKTLLAKGVSADEVSRVAEGLALLRDKGELRGYHLEPGEPLNLRLVYAVAASDDGRLPLWRRAELAHFEASKQRNGNHKSGLQRIGE